MALTNVLNKIHNIRSYITTAKNPQANLVCERIHQTIGNSLDVLATLQPPQDIEAAHHLVDTAIANTVFVHCFTFSSTHSSTSGGLVFQRDMILEFSLLADFQIIREKHQQLIDQRLVDANQKRFSHDYIIGKEILKLNLQANKLEPRATEPYVIEQVYANGTVIIRIAPNVIEHTSLWRIKPYQQ